MYLTMNILVVQWYLWECFQLSTSIARTNILLITSSMKYQISENKWCIWEKEMNSTTDLDILSMMHTQ